LKIKVVINAIMMTVLLFGITVMANAALPGDTNNDNSVSISEVQTVINAFLGLTPSTTNYALMAGNYSGSSNGGPFLDDSADITVSVTSTDLKVTLKEFYSGTCMYTGNITGTPISGTYQCSDFTTGNWTLKQMKVVDVNDIYLAILKNGTTTSRAYGLKAK
jgi:hypothetical protein